MNEDYNFIEIDEYKLDEACMSQSKHYMEWALKLADAQFNADEAKAQLELIEVELARDIRNHPGQFDVKRVTDKAVAETVKSHKSYQKGLTKLHQKTRRVGRIKAVVNALDHRKKMIEAMVFLRGQNYYSEPDPNRRDRIKDRKRQLKEQKFQERLTTTKPRK